MHQALGSGQRGGAGANQNHASAHAGQRNRRACQPVAILLSPGSFSMQCAVLTWAITLAGASPTSSQRSQRSRCPQVPPSPILLLPRDAIPGANSARRASSRPMEQPAAVPLRVQPERARRTPRGRARRLHVAHRCLPLWLQPLPFMAATLLLMGLQSFPVIASVYGCNSPVHGCISSPTNGGDFKRGSRRPLTWKAGTRRHDRRPAPAALPAARADLPHRHVTPLPATLLLS
eukprot:2740878-Rhodomonas_salina.2